MTTTSRRLTQADTPDPEPDDGLIAVTVRLTPEQVRATAAIHPNSFNGRDDHGQSVCALDDLPDLTESQCRDAYYATMAQPDTPYLNGVIGRALIAAGYTPEEEA